MSDALSPRTALKLAWMSDHDAPERAALSKRARARISERFDTIAAGHGFEAQSGSWIRSKGLSRLSVSLQPSRYGFECFVNLRVAAPVFPKGVGRIWMPQQVRLGAFYDRRKVPNGEPGALVYPEVLEDGHGFEEACRVLDQRALPYLRRQSVFRRGDLKAYLGNCPPV